MYKIRKIVFHEHPVLKNLSLNFCDSEGKCIDTIIFAGENGTGKCIIFHLLCALFDTNRRSQFLHKQLRPDPGEMPQP